MVGIFKLPTSKGFNFQDRAYVKNSPRDLTKCRNKMFKDNGWPP